MIYLKKIITTSIFISVIFSKNVINPDSLRYKVAYATRCEVSPVIDGVLNDSAWYNSIIISDFLQLVPVEFDKPSEKTEVRILFDDNALYMSFLNFDSNSKKIRAPLTRRDAYMDGFNTVADFIGIAVDSRNDDFNGKWFGVNACRSKNRCKCIWARTMIEAGMRFGMQPFRKTIVAGQLKSEFHFLFFNMKIKMKWFGNIS